MCIRDSLEAVRNTPLVVQLLFWYSLVTINLPSARQALQPLPGVDVYKRQSFSAPDKDGNWKGLDVDTCRAIAIAVLGLSLIHISWSRRHITKVHESILQTKLTHEFTQS